MTRQQVGFAVLVLWVPVTLLMVAFVMVDHVAPLPPPGDASTVLRAARALGSGRTGQRAVHVIYEHCSCTNRLVTHLLERGPRADWQETVLYVGEDDTVVHAAAKRGFAARRIGRSELRRGWALDGAPVLVALDETDDLAYLGGYFQFPRRSMRWMWTFSRRWSVVHGRRAFPCSAARSTRRWPLAGTRLGFGGGNDTVTSPRLIASHVL